VTYSNSLPNQLEGHVFPLLRLDEVARLLKVSPETVRVWAEKGEIPAYRIGPRRALRFKVQDIGEASDLWFSLQTFRSVYSTTTSSPLQLFTIGHHALCTVIYDSTPICTYPDIQIARYSNLEKRCLPSSNRFRLNTLPMSDSLGWLLVLG
jgi:excisionase family DNA binding protein